MSRGNLDKIYKKDSINTDLLAKLCIILDHDFFQYINPFVLAERDGPRLYGAEEDPGERRTPMSRLTRCQQDLHDAQKDLNFMEQELGRIKAHTADKDTIITIYKERIDELREKLDACSADKA